MRTKTEKDKTERPAEAARHIELRGSTMLAPVPVVLVAASCSKAQLRARRAEDPAAFDAAYAESLGEAILSQLDEGAGEERIRTLTLIAWTGVLSSEPPRLGLSIRRSRLLYSLCCLSGRYAVFPLAEPFLKRADFCGVRSGREVDKFSPELFSTYAYGGDPDLPLLEEAPLALLCRLEQRLVLDSHELFVSGIERVLLKPELIDGAGKVHLERAALVAYAHGEYCGLGEALGFFGYSLAAEEVLQRRLPGRFGRARAEKSSAGRAQAAKPGAGRPKPAREQSGRAGSEGAGAEKARKRSGRGARNTR